MTAGYAIAPGRADHDTHLLVQEIVASVIDEIEGRLLGVVVNGRVPSTAVSGQLGASQGGTGNSLGQTAPLDGSVTNAKVAAGANIDPAKLDSALLLALAYTLVKGYLVAGTNITVTADDAGHHLTIASPSPVTTLDNLSDVVITDPQPGDMLMAFLEGGSIVWRNVRGLPAADGGALYVGGDYMTIGGDTLTVGG